MKKAFSILGIMVGIAIIVLGIYMARGELNTSMTKRGYYSGRQAQTGIEFGADFYTEEYTATMAAANNVDNLGDYLSSNLNAMDNYIEETVEKIVTFVGYIIATFGGVVVCYFGVKFGETLNARTATPVIVRKEAPEEISEALPDL